MDTLSLQIAKAVETLLGSASVTIYDGSTLTKPTGLVVQRERVTQVTPDDVEDGPLVLVSIAAEPAIDPVGNNNRGVAVKRRLEILIDIFADATDTPPSDAVDPAYVWVVMALQSDPRLGGLAHWIQERAYESQYTSFADSARVMSARAVRFYIEHHTRRDDPRVRS